MPENFEFGYQWVLWLAPLPILLYWLMPAFRTKSASLRVPSFEKTQEFTGNKPRGAALVKKRGIFTWIVLFLIWCLLLLTLASPQLVAKPEMKVKTSRNFLIVADISFSMAQTDWVIDGKKASRWEAIKHVMHDFIQKREGDRMGLIFFGSNAYVQAPFTSDLETVDLLLEEADIGMAGQMTNIGKAIVKGVEMFKQDTIDTKVMLLLTDGVDGGSEILPLDAADIAKKDTINIYTLGIGDPSSSNSDLDEETLKNISEVTDAKYFRAIDSEQLASVYTELDSLEPIEFEEEEYKPKTVLYFYPLGVALGISILLLSIYGLLALFKKKKSS